MGLGLGAKLAAKLHPDASNGTRLAPTLPTLAPQDPQNALFPGFCARGPDTLIFSSKDTDCVLHQINAALVIKASEKSFSISDRRAFTDATGKEVFTMKSRQIKDDYLGYIGDRRVVEIEEVSKTDFAAEHRMSFTSPATGATAELVLTYTEQGDGRITDAHTGNVVSAFYSDPNGDDKVHVAAGVDVASVMAMLVCLDVVCDESGGTSGKLIKAFGEGLGEGVVAALT